MFIAVLLVTFHLNSKFVSNGSPKFGCSFVFCFMASLDPTKYSNRTWNAHFGISKITMMLLFAHMQQFPWLKFELKHLLWTFYFVKVYCTYDVAATYWNVHHNTYRHWVWKTLFVLECSLNQVLFVIYQFIITYLDLFSRPLI